MRSIFLAFFFACLAIAGPAAAESVAKLRVEAIHIDSSGKRIPFTAEIADTPEARARGLMHRAEMADDHGMLFDFGETRNISMWMKNTPLSLDMIFADAEGNIIHVAESTLPYSEDIVTAGRPARAVFEVKAGTARRLGIRAGDRIQARMFGSGGG